MPNWDRFTIVGTSQEIFKDYLRLTSVRSPLPLRIRVGPTSNPAASPARSQEPKPEQIRPYHVLQDTLTQLKKRWREKATYNWICSQFKSLRQDLTVRRAPAFSRRPR